MSKAQEHEACFKHEAPIAGNASVTETYELTQEELLPMISRGVQPQHAAHDRV